MKEEKLTIYPRPKFAQISGDRIDASKIGILDDSAFERFRKILSKEGISYGDINSTCRFKLEFSKLHLQEFKDLCIPQDVEINEVYGLCVKDNQISFYGNSEKAFFYGATTLFNIIETNNMFENMRILDYPHMKIRGIIEGFYGKPWSESDRVEAVNTISVHKMNTYIYAPKDDPYHREKWKEHYPEPKLLAIKKLFEHCKSRFIDFYYTVGPGLSMKYSCEENFEKLLQKYMSMYSMGIRNFGLLLDDIPARLLYEEDSSRFESLAEAHVYIINKLYSKLKTVDSGNKLLVCGTVYSGRGNEDYIVKLGQSISEDINIFWTGRQICSHELDSRDAEIFFKKNRHKPLYWDNYPVNDADMQDELHIGPVSCRDIDLYKHSEGLVANVMEYKEASMIPVITLCHYLWDCETYDKERSLQSAVREVAGKADFNDFLKFNRYCCKSCLSPASSEEFIEKVIEFKHASYKEPHEFEAVLDRLLVYFAENAKSAHRLEKHMDNRKLLTEVKPWLIKFKHFNRFCYYMIKYMLCTLKGKKSKAAFSGVKALIFYKFFCKSNIQMMNFEAQVLIQSGKN